MSAKNLSGRTWILLSFSSAYSDLARRLAGDLKASNIAVRYDQWEGGGGTPSIQSLANDVNDVAFVLPLLTPSEAAPTWIEDEWRRAIYDEARARGIGVLPVWGDGDLDAIPGFLRDLSFADLHKQDYALELRRLVETIRDLSNDAGIKLPAVGPEVDGTRSLMTLPANPLVLELGEELAPRFASDEGASRFLNEMVPMMRDGLFYELGVQFPSPHLRVSPDVPPSFVQIVINDIPETQVELRPDSVMVNDRVAAMAERGFVAEPAINPASGATCAWIPAQDAAAARASGLTTWDAHEFLILSLSSILRRKAADFIGIDKARSILKQLEPVFPQLVSETVPNTVSLFLLTDVLRRLLAEEISIRNMRRILMALADWGRVEKDPHFLTEYVRAALQRQITHKFSRGTKELIVFLLHPELETTIQNAIQHTATGSYIDLEPANLRKIVGAIGEPMRMLPDDVQMPVILTTLEIRSSVRRLVALPLPRLHVLSYQELAPDTNVQPVGRISLEGFSPRDGAMVGGVPLWNC